MRQQYKKSYRRKKAEVKTTGKVWEAYMKDCPGNDELVAVISFVPALAKKAFRELEAREKSAPGTVLTRGVLNEIVKSGHSGPVVKKARLMLEELQANNRVSLPRIIFGHTFSIARSLDQRLVKHRMYLFEKLQEITRPKRYLYCKI
ncbi:MAG: hypothetical protein PHP03_02760 [Candidatus Pacebacteria bacterium]|nr:hypothetical protein [Candidatus Paceibacterota bacterium]